MTQPQFQKVTLVLPVHDIAATIRWYERVLGLETVYLHEGGEPEEATNYAIMRREGVEVHFLLDEPPREHPWTTAGTGYLYLTVRDIDEVFADVSAQNVPLKRGLERENWGVRGFLLSDPSGNEVRICEAAE